MNDANQAVLENIFERKFVCRISIDTLFTVFENDTYLKNSITLLQKQYKIRKYKKINYSFTFN